jgi:hypothetical protein
MHRLAAVILLSAAVVVSLVSFQAAFAAQSPYGGRQMQPAQPGKPTDAAKPITPVSLLAGKWTMTNNPVDESGKPCPYLPKTIEFFQDGTLLMSNVGDIHMHYKTELMAKETEAFDKRPELKGQQLLLIRPTSEMAWTATPMVYTYTVNRIELTLTMQGWPKATFKRTK